MKKGRRFKGLLVSLVIMLSLVMPLLRVSPASACPLFVNENAQFLTDIAVTPLVSNVDYIYDEFHQGMPTFSVSSDESYSLQIQFSLLDNTSTAFFKILRCGNDGFPELYRIAFSPSQLVTGNNSFIVTLPSPQAAGMNEASVYMIKVAGVAGHLSEVNWNSSFADGCFAGRTAEELSHDDFEVAYQVTVKVEGEILHNPFISSLSLTPSKTTLAPGESFNITARYYRYYYCPSDYFKFLAKNEQTGEITELGRWAASYWEMVSYGWQTFSRTLVAPSTPGTYTVKAVGCSGHGTYNFFGVDWNDPRCDGGFAGHRPEELSWTFYEIANQFSISVITYTINVTIVEVKAIDTLDPIGPLSAADFYAKVSIDGVSLPNSPIRSNANDIYPEWSFSRTVSKTTVPIHIEIWDSDWPLPDDHVDIDKDANDRDLDLFFDVTTQSLSGDVTYGYSKGGGDSNRAEIWFNVGLDNGDKDGDGLFDSWETAGIHMDDDGIVDLNLSALGANPDHKDLFVEIDWMENQGHSHRPGNAVIQTVMNSFANAPVSSNPDGTTGINLHVDFSNSIPHRDSITWNEFDIIKATNFDANRRFAYHYCLFAHNIATGTGNTAGLGEYPGNDFLIGLGDTSTSTGQAGVFMHELGHNLYLHHGGGDDTNFKPNYLSVMNYYFAYEGILPTHRVDYSRQALTTLDENNLNEHQGIQDGTDMTMYYDGTNVVTAPGTGPVDWDGDGIIETNVQADINQHPLWMPGVGSGRTVLTGYDDWANLRLNSRGITNDWADYVHEFYDVEVDTKTLSSIRPTQVVQKFAEGPVAVPLSTIVSWAFTFSVTNIEDYEITNVTVKDYFGANVNVTFVSSTKGQYIQKTNRPALQQRFEWNIGNLAPWETATLKLEASTGSNPMRKQEFTQPGLKALNSGATVKWINNSGLQESAETGPVFVWAGVSVSSTTGAIAGYVTKATTGEPRSGCVVELRDSMGVLIGTVSSDKRGFYSFSSLTPGNYMITCGGNSYTVAVMAEQVTRADFSLG